MRELDGNNRRSVYIIIRVCVCVYVCKIFYCYGAEPNLFLFSFDQMRNGFHFLAGCLRILHALYVCVCVCMCGLELRIQIAMNYCICEIELYSVV